MPEKPQNKVYAKLHSLALSGKIYQNLLGSDRALFVTNAAVQDIRDLGIKPSVVGENVKLLYTQDPRYDITGALYTISFAQVSEAIEKADKGNSNNLELAASVYNAAAVPPLKDAIIDGIVKSDEQVHRRR